MLTGKERRQLKKEIHGQDPKLYIGKNGITENLITETHNLLEKYELIKVKVQNSVIEDKGELMEELIQAVDGEYVMDLGSVFAIYKENLEKDKSK